MHFLIDADLPRSLKPLIEHYGHEATDVRDIGLGSASDPPIAAYAQAHRVCLLSGDFGFADIRNYVPAAYAGLVVLELPRNATASFIVHHFPMQTSPVAPGARQSSTKRHCPLKIALCQHRV